MMVTEKTPVAEAALPVIRLKDHLRLASGFAEDQIQNSLLAGFVRAALAAIETRTGKALIEREFEWTVTGWRTGMRDALPMAPVSAIASVAQVSTEGGVTTVPSDQYHLVPDTHSPRICGQPLPAVPAGGHVRVTFTAGMSPSFDGLPPDLAQAVMLLAAHYYEYRDETALGSGCMPFGVTALIDRYRPLRIGLGADQ